VSQFNHDLSLDWADNLPDDNSSIWAANEDALVNACGKKHPGAQRYLYDKFAGKMYRVCLRYAGDADFAKDIMQEGFIKVFYNIKHFRGDSKLETWVTRIMINCSITAVKREAARFIKKDSAELKIPVDPEEYETPFAQNQKLTADFVLKKITELPTGYRTVLSMYALDAYSHKEIAEVLGISEGTSKSQLAKARKMLIKLISDES
jgi:RNA polymerase sigma factor (sigma-70 family)